MKATAGIPPDLVARLRDARSVAALTGAGISAESGIPTFRDALTGLWARYRPEELATPEAFARNPALVWDWYRMRRQLVARAEPNAGHRALVALERRVPRFALITQNVDGLHRRAGSERVVELHGSLARARCSREGTVLERWEETEGAPPCCQTCGAPLRPDVVWFGELLPEEALRAAEAAARDCEVFLSIGTSNLVEPAASLPWRAAAAGADVAVINVTMDGQPAGPRIHHLVGRAGELLPALVESAWPGR
jgi:NAD-dependent deacetylase